MIHSVAGIVLWTDDLDNLVRFYQNTLGLVPHSVRPRFVSFKFGNFRLGIGLHQEVAGKSTEPLRIMVNLGIDDIHVEYHRLITKGVDFIRPPEKEHWGGWIATFQDPDGNTLQLIQIES